MPTQPSRPARPWPLTALSLLLFLQSGGLLALSLWNFRELQLIVTAGGWEIKQPHKLLSGVLVWLAALALLAAINLLRAKTAPARRIAWLSAMLLQGLNLLTALILHFRDRDWIAYIMMLYGIFMVVYLNYAEAQALVRLHTEDSTRPDR